MRDWKIWEREKYGTSRLAGCFSLPNGASVTARCGHRSRFPGRQGFGEARLCLTGAVVTALSLH